MNGFDLIVDTNILIYILDGNKQVAEATHDKQINAYF